MSDMNLGDCVYCGKPVYYSEEFIQSSNGVAHNDCELQEQQYMKDMKDELREVAPHCDWCKFLDDNSHCIASIPCINYCKFEPKEGYTLSKSLKESTPLVEVNHPSHYNQGKIEVIDVIYDWNLNFSLGSALKYIARCDFKGTPVKDLEKAVEYIEFEIAHRKGMTIDEYRKENADVNN